MNVHGGVSLYLIDWSNGSNMRTHIPAQTHMFLTWS